MVRKEMVRWRNGEIVRQRDREVERWEKMDKPHKKLKAWQGAMDLCIRIYQMTAYGRANCNETEADLEIMFRRLTISPSHPLTF